MQGLYQSQLLADPGERVQREEAVLLADRLSQLPASYRRVLVLRNLQGMPFEEVAREIDRSVGATRMLWLRAIEKLRAVYRKEEQRESS